MEGGRERENTTTHLLSTHAIYLRESMHTDTAQGRKSVREGGTEERRERWMEGGREGEREGGKD